MDARKVRTTCTNGTCASGQISRRSDGDLQARGRASCLLGDREWYARPLRPRSRNLRRALGFGSRASCRRLPDHRLRPPRLLFLLHLTGRLGDPPDDAIALIEGLNAAPAVIIGYSAGAIIALQLALRRPELLSSIVLLDPAFNLKQSMTPGFLTTFGRVQISRRIGRHRAAVERWLRYVSSYSTGGSAYDTKTPPERREKLLMNAAGIFADFGSGGGSVDESRLASISVPITLVELELSPPFLRRGPPRWRPGARCGRPAAAGRASGCCWWWCCFGTSCPPVVAVSS